MADEGLLLATWSSSADYSIFRIGPYVLGPAQHVIATVGSVHSKLVVDHKKGAGVDGGNIVLRGLEVREVPVDIEIWDGIGEALWDQLVPILMPLKSASKRVSWPVAHPALARHSIAACVVKDISEKAPDARGVLRAQMVLRETRKREGGTTKKPAPQPVPTANIKPRAVAAPFLPGVRPSQKAKP